MQTVVGRAAAEAIVIPHAVTYAVGQARDSNWLAVIVVGTRCRAAIFVAAIGCAQQIRFSQGFRCRRIDLCTVNERAAGGRVHRCGYRNWIGASARRQRTCTDGAGTHDFNGCASLWRARPVGTCCADRSQTRRQFVFDHNRTLRCRWAVVLSHEAVRYLADAWRVGARASDGLRNRQINIDRRRYCNRRRGGFADYRRCSDVVLIVSPSADGVADDIHHILAARVWCNTSRTLQINRAACVDDAHCAAACV